MENEKDSRFNNPISRLWKWWFTVRTTDPTVAYRERALRVLLPMFLFLRFFGTIARHFVNSDLPEHYAPEWLSVLFFVVPILLSFYLLLKQKVGWAGAFFILHWFLVDLLSLPSEGYWYAGFQISLIIQVILAALLLPSRGMLPFLVIQLVSFGLWGHWLDVNYYDPPLLSSGQPVAVFRRTIVTLGSQEAIILFIVRYLRLAMEKSLRLQQDSIGKLETEVNERQRAETRMRGIFQNSPDFIMEMDRDGTVLFANRRSEEYVGNKIPQYLPSGSERQVEDVIVQAYETGKPQIFEIQLFEDDGSLQWYSIRLGPIMSEGRVDRLVVISTNIHAQIEAGEVQKKLISELEFKNAELERFTYTVSHELKTPLVTMKGFMGSVQRDLQDGNIKRALDDFPRVLTAADKMYQTIKDLLELSRIGRIVSPPVEIDTSQLIHDALESLDGQLHSKNIKVKIAEDLPLISGDRTRLREVFENLIGNAAKCMGDQIEPLIEIGTQNGEGHQVFYVKDNGMGIDPQYHNRIFNLFEKLNPAIEGTGVGLTLVKRIVEYHGGRIWIESDGQGKGSTFCFTLSDTRN